MITRDKLGIVVLIFGLLVGEGEAFYLGKSNDYNLPPAGETTTFMQAKSEIPAITNAALPDVLTDTDGSLGIDAPYCKYILIYNLTPFYIALDDNLSRIIDSALTNFGIEDIRSYLSAYNLEIIDLRSAIFLLLKSPYYVNGNLALPDEALSGLDSRTSALFLLAQELSQMIPYADKEYIRNFNVSIVEPDIKLGLSYEKIKSVFLQVRQQKILEGKVDYGVFYKYKDEIERAVVSAIAGFNYSSDRFHLLSEEITPQAKNDFYNRIRFWLKTQEYIPPEIFSLVEDKAKELFDSLRIKKGLFPTSPWQGEIAQIYRLFGGEIPNQLERGKLSPFADWGEDIYKRLWDISSNIEKAYSSFGVLLKGPDMTLEQLKTKIDSLGPAIVGINREGRKDFVKVLEIFSPDKGEGTVTCQDANGNVFALLLGEFFTYWDRFVYIPEEKSISASVISDFDFSNDRFGLIKGYGQWTINEFDDLKAKIGINTNIPLSSTLPYFYTQYQIGGEKTYKYAGYFQTGIWLTFKEDIKSLLLRGSALSFDAYVSAYPGIKYVRIELKEDETGRIISEFIIPRERLNLANWNTFKIPIHYYPAGTLVLTLGVIGTYPGLYAPQNHFLAIDRLYIE
ncbi:MAG: hypothetical protein NC818_00105 [Candidatus Omnitrophica bacterium]|nr:hypothetical protein [Candidatus Omnitrophota bacterium]